MQIQLFDQDRIKKICNHEVGHYITSRELLFKTHGITAQFQLPNRHSGEAGIEPWQSSISTLKGLEEYLERRIQVLYAGAIAEAMDINGNYNSDFALKEWRTGGSVNDHAKIRELTHVLRNIKYPETTDEKNAQTELDTIDGSLISKAGYLVHERIELVHGIGDMLFQKVKSYNVKYELTEVEIEKVKQIRELYIDNK